MTLQLNWCRAWIKSVHSGTKAVVELHHPGLDVLVKHLEIELLGVQAPDVAANPEGAAVAQERLRKLAYEKWVAVRIWRNLSPSRGRYLAQMVPIVDYSHDSCEAVLGAKSINDIMAEEGLVERYDVSALSLT